MIATIERLIGALEELLRAEEISLRAGDCQGAAQVQAKTGPLVASLAEILTARSPDERLPGPVSDRLGRLQLRRRENLLRLAGLKASRQADLRRIQEARSRIKRLRPVYTAPRPRSTFAAAG